MNNNSANLLLVYLNGYAAARDLSLRDRTEILKDVSEAYIKPTILSLLQKVNGRQGYVLVRWHDKRFVCEPHRKKGYVRVDVQHHPLESKLV